MEVSLTVSFFWLLFCTKNLNEFFESNIKTPRIRIGQKQTIETLINEEALLFAKFLKNERKIWSLRIVE